MIVAAAGAREIIGSGVRFCDVGSGHVRGRLPRPAAPGSKQLYVSCAATASASVGGAGVRPDGHGETAAK